MRFQVPQFIDVEDKIFGPLTLKQFIYLAGGASIALVASTFFGWFFGLILSSPVIVLALALAFYRVNNRPFIETIEAATKFYSGEKLYIWKKQEKVPEETVGEAPKYSSIVLPNLSSSKLKDMSWELDVSKKNVGEKIVGEE